VMLLKIELMLLGRCVRISELSGRVLGILGWIVEIGRIVGMKWLLAVVFSGRYLRFFESFRDGGK